VDVETNEAAVILESRKRAVKRLRGVVASLEEKIASIRVMVEELEQVREELLNVLMVFTFANELDGVGENGAV